MTRCARGFQKPATKWRRKRRPGAAFAPNTRKFTGASKSPIRTEAEREIPKRPCAVNKTEGGILPKGFCCATALSFVDCVAEEQEQRYFKRRYALEN